MRSLRFGIALAGAVLVHVVGLHLFSWFFLGVDLLLVLLVFNALDGDSLAGMLGGCIAGLVTDALTGGSFGLYGMVNTLLGYATAYAAHRLVIQRATGVFLIFTLAAAIQQLFLTGILVLMLQEPELPAYTWVLMKVAVTGLLGVTLFLGTTRLQVRLETRRRARTGKIRFSR